MLALRLQLVAYAGMVAALAAAGGVACALGAAVSAGRDGVMEAGRESALGLGRSIAASLERGDLVSVHRVAAAAAEGWAVARVVVLDADGRACADVAGVSGEEEGAGIGWGALMPAGPLEVEEPAATADGRVVGWVRLRFSDGAVGERVGAAAGRIAAAGAGAGLLAVAAAAGVTLAAAGRLTGPLGRVERVLRGLEEGNFEARAPERGARGLMGLVRGVNGAAEREGKLSASTSFINNIVQSMVDTLIVVDQQARITMVNRATLELLGYEEEELVGRTASLICVADGYHLTAAQLERVLGQGAKQDHEVTYIAKDGARVPISLSGSAVRDRSGRPTGYVCIGTDITHRKVAEAERDKLHKQLMATSRQAGMAEVATGVLHNVGNVLNSVNVSATLVEEAVRKSKVAQVGQVASLLGEHEGDLGAFMTADERGRVLPKYLAQLAGHLAKERETLLEEVRSLASHIGHIKDIISVQQTISKTSGVIEAVEVRDLVEDAVRMLAGSLDRHHVRLVREYGELRPVSTDKHKVLQIMVNLVSNALDAVKEAPDRDGVLTVRVRGEEGDGAGEGTGGVRIEVCDNGVGIAPEHLTRIFTHGFTTKKKGHGFGLHSAALAAKELGGSLTAHSAGPGMGAAFVLSLPYERAESTRAQAA